MTTPNMVLCAIFQTLASSPSPIHIHFFAIAWKYGSAILYKSLGPEDTTSNKPAFATLALPETGAHKYPMPKASNSLRTSAEPS